jgi:hypothetical protein
MSLGLNSSSKTVPSRTTERLAVTVVPTVAKAEEGAECLEMAVQESFLVVVAAAVQAAMVVRAEPVSVVIQLWEEVVVVVEILIQALTVQPAAADEEGFAGAAMVGIRERMAKNLQAQAAAGGVAVEMTPVSSLVLVMARMGAMAAVAGAALAMVVMAVLAVAVALAVDRASFLSRYVAVTGALEAAAEPCMARGAL